MRKIILSVALVAMLSGCAPPLDTTFMRPLSDVVQQIPANTSLERSVKLGQVNVPKQYASNDIGSLDSAGLRYALSDSLLLVNYLPRQGDEPKFTLNANLTELDIPRCCFSLDSSSTINYSLLRVSDGTEVFRETIKKGYHAPFAEAMNGTERSRLASSKAIRENITHALRVLANLNESDLKGK
jgi:hypothetical protein